MAVYKYTAIDKDGTTREGTIDAHNVDVAIGSLQNRGLIISEIKEQGEGSIFEKNISFGGVKNKDIVILSRQMATLFEAQVSALRVFRLLSKEAENVLLQKALTEVADDISDGSSVTDALKKHPKIFSAFYVNMVASGEESGKMSQTFLYLADYLDRTYELTSKAKNALVYPAFVIGIFFIVMYLMLTMVIPKIAKILIDSGQEIPFFTQIVINLSNFLVDYGFIFIAGIVIGVVFLRRYFKTEEGARGFDKFKLMLPVLGNLYEKLYLARISGNMNMMLVSGISMVKTIENTSKVVDNKIFEDILVEVSEDISGGASVSDSFAKHEEIPTMLTQMIKVGEETGKIANILETMAKFYEREVINAVDTMVGLIEPLMIVMLGLGVGGLLSAVLVPIYNITGSV